MMNDTEINDISYHASATASTMTLVNSHTVYTLNGTIRVKIVLFDHKQRPKTRGGDMLILWMRDRSKGAASAGSVTDHDNGTYTGILRILWTGQAVIRAAILCTREKMAFMHRELRKGYVICPSPKRSDGFKHPLQKGKLPEHLAVKPFLGPHGLPMSFENANRTAIRPCFVHLDEIPSGSRDIVLIHLYAHFQVFPLHVFKARMKYIRLATERLLIRSPDIKIVIKGPHYFIKHSTRNTLGGLWGPLYDKIIRQEFVSLYARVIYLDVWDMHVTGENSDVHPSEGLLKTMLRTLFGYVCSK
ncbi:NXPE family member 3-like [Haliotis rubra]|uniref:NXPE family member 3-like n=1 Tax=Haliotis rubra TaxID=36100 RepID=UPI001EE5C553|nr:NXPE family member 3-like [Haliotis rubra]